MEKEGYTRKYAAAITAASSVIGPIIPPSGIMIIYAYVMGESVAALFLAGIVPGILVGVGLMVMVRLTADKYDLPAAKRVVLQGTSMGAVEWWVSFALVRLNIGLVIWSFVPLGEDASATANWLSLGGALLAAHGLFLGIRQLVGHDFRMVCKRAMVPLQTPILILGGILVGIFTPTEAAAIAVFYATLVGFFILRTLKMKDMPLILMKAASTSAVVLLLVGAAMAFKTVVSLSHAPEQLAAIILGLSDNPLVLLLLINLLLFIVGMFLDAGPAIIILGPILGPIFVDLGVHPVHFAIIMSVNLTVGLATPPMGLVLFVASSVSGERVEAIARAILPFLLVEIFVIFLITYIPAISMTIPRLTGFVN
jgi:TRAP-type C4-dicarboxylate transport system permease large subunit